MMTLGGRIKAQRNALKMTQHELAYLAGITPGHMSRIESNEFGDIKFGTLRAIAAAMGVSVAMLAPEVNTVERPRPTKRVMPANNRVGARLLATV